MFITSKQIGYANTFSVKYNVLLSIVSHYCVGENEIQATTNVLVHEAVLFLFSLCPKLFLSLTVGLPDDFINSLERVWYFERCMIIIMHTHV